MSEECTQWLNEIDALAADGLSNKEVLYNKTKTGYEQFEGASIPDLQWRMGRAAYLLAAQAEKKGDKEAQKKLLIEAEELLKKAIVRLPEHPEARAWLCYTLGKVSGFLSSKEKARKGKELHDNLVVAIELNPEDANLYHTFGRWCLEVAGLSWLEKKTASMVFGAKLEATYDDALKYFLKSDELKPRWKTNYGYIAQTYIAKSNYKDAMQWVENGLKLPDTNDEDEITQKLLLNLQKKYAKYK